MMAKQNGRTTPVVPFPRFFAVLGYSIFSLMCIAVLGELCSWIVYIVLFSLFPSKQISERTYRGETAVYQEAEKRAAASKEYIFFGRLFDRVDAPLYTDWTHLAARGNEIVAKAIAHEIEAQPSSRNH